MGVEPQGRRGQAGWPRRLVHGMSCSLRRGLIGVVQVVAGKSGEGCAWLPSPHPCWLCTGYQPVGPLWLGHYMAPLYLLRREQKGVLGPDDGARARRPPWADAQVDLHQPGRLAVSGVGLGWSCPAELCTFVIVPGGPWGSPAAAAAAAALGPALPLWVADDAEGHVRLDVQGLEALLELRTDLLLNERQQAVGPSRCVGKVGRDGRRRKELQVGRGWGVGVGGRVCRRSGMRWGGLLVCKVKLARCLLPQ